MSMIRCKDGLHFYDSEKHLTCPYCAKKTGNYTEASGTTVRVGIENEHNENTGNSYIDNKTKLNSLKSLKTILIESKLSSKGKRFKIFLSSTYEDLREYRDAAFNAIHSIGYYCEDMKNWPAYNQNGIIFSIEKVSQCDVFILILAHRYGSIDPKTHCSIVELEYNKAKDLKIPILAFFLDENIPWPPKYIEWSNKEKLNNLKKSITADTVIKFFKSPYDLAAKVTQSLVLLKPDNSDIKFSTIKVDPNSNLTQKPDIVVKIGSSLEETDLLFLVKRSKNNYIENKLKLISQEFYKLKDIIPNDLNLLFDSFLQTKAQNDYIADAKDRIEDVRMLDNTIKKLYISKNTLMKLFNSTFSIIVKECTNNNENISNNRIDTVTDIYDIASPGAIRTMDMRFSSLPIEKTIEEANEAYFFSVGGKNRFLGVSISDDRVYSVGLKDGSWVEWRPFFAESITKNFPKGCFIVKYNDKTQIIKPKRFSKTLTKIAKKLLGEDGILEIDVSFSMSRQEIAELVLKIAHNLHSIHTKNIIHGDIKPENVILTPNGPLLIDSFNLKSDDISPGWTPYWAAPEQFLQDKISFKTDIYPLGKILTEIINAHLVGEVKKFKTPPLPNGINEYDLFINPTIYIDQENKVIRNQKFVNKWISFIKNCLAFEMNKRPSLNQFCEGLHELILLKSLSGDIKIQLPSSYCASKYIDGRVKISQVVLDI